MCPKTVVAHNLWTIACKFIEISTGSAGRNTPQIPKLKLFILAICILGLDHTIFEVEMGWLWNCYPGWNLSLRLSPSKGDVG